MIPRALLAAIGKFWRLRIARRQRYGLPIDFPPPVSYRGDRS